MFAATHRELGGEFAVKRIEKAFLATEDEKQSLRREVELHLRLHHPNIVRLYEVYEDAANMWLVMERNTMGGGTLVDVLDFTGKVESEELCCKLVHQIVVAVHYLHAHGVLHSDIKPENCVVNGLAASAGAGPLPLPNAAPWHIKICDFGLARKVPDVKYFKHTGDVHKVPFTGVRGTPGYIAPELLRKQPYGISADMWSVGIIMYELLCGRAPFQPAAACLEAGRQPLFEGRAWRQASPEAIDLLQQLLVVDAAARISAADALKHPWFAKFGLGWLRNGEIPQVARDWGPDGTSAWKKF